MAGKKNAIVLKGDDVRSVREPGRLSCRSTIEVPRECRWNRRSLTVGLLTRAFQEHFKVKGLPR
jgi:hypothetical protein